MMRAGFAASTVRCVGKVFTLSLTAALNPTLLAATTVMLTLSSPKRLLSGYLAGAMITSLTCGMVLVFTLNGSSTSSTAKHTVSPAIDFALGGLLLVVAFVVGTGRDKRRRARAERKREEKKDKPPPRWKRQLSKGSARDTFLVGVLLSFPGASYIAGMDALSKQNLSTTATVFAVIGFNVIMLMLLELPLIGYATRPEWTESAVARFNGWLSRSGGKAALIAATVIGALLVLRGALTV
jgi:Sap, sulfolipid-1-addressing protein